MKLSLNAQIQLRAATIFFIKLTSKACNFISKKKSLLCTAKSPSDSEIKEPLPELASERTSISNNIKNRFK